MKVLKFGMDIKTAVADPRIMAKDTNHVDVEGKQ